MSRRWKLIPCVLLTSVALVVPTQGAVSGAAASRPQAPAQSHGPAKAGRWVQLSSSSGISSIHQPSVMRLRSGGIQVVWPQGDAGSTESIRSRIVKESGRIGSPISTVVKGWSDVVDDPRVIAHGAKRLVAFGGLRSPDVGETLTGEMAYSTSGNGTKWKLGAGSLTHTTYAYASYGSSAIDDGGTPIVGVNAPTAGSQVTLHRGIDSSRPAAAADWTTKSGAFGCCAYHSALAQDARSDQVWTAWYSNSSTRAHLGILAEKVFPKPVGKVRKAPGSSTGSNSLDPGQQVALAASSSGGIFVAYKVGYPTANHIRIWEVGTRHTLTISAKDVTFISLQPGTQGRLWLAWLSRSQNVIHVARTNAAVTHLGAVRSVAPPGGHSATVWNVTGAGSAGPFHLVVNAQPLGKKAQIWYQKVSPGLTLVAKPRSLDKGVVTAKVTDAGKAVAHAKVTFRGQSKQTNGRGIAKFRVPGSAHSGRYAMTATKAGYFRGHASVKVT
jgi:hypothetical protein